MANLKSKNNRHHLAFETPEFKVTIKQHTAKVYRLSIVPKNIIWPMEQKAKSLQTPMKRKDWQS